MLKMLRTFITFLLLVAALGIATASPAFAQTTVSSTTLSAAVTSSQSTFTVASATGIDVGDLMFVDREFVRVTAISGTTITVRRGQEGSAARAHGSGAILYHGPSNNFSRDDVAPGSACTASDEAYLPRIVIPSGRIYQCSASVWHELGSNGGTFTVTFNLAANASLADQAFWIADRDYEIVAIAEVHSTAGSDVGAVNLQVTKDTGTNAPGAGTDLLTNNSNAGFDLKGTANTVQNGTLTSTAASKRLAAGNRLAVDFAGTLTALAGVVVTVTLTPR